MACIRRKPRVHPTAVSCWNPENKSPMKRRGTPNEPVPRAASRRRRDRLVARLETLHTSFSNARKPMEACFNHSQPAPAIDLVPRIDCRRAREPPSAFARRLSPLPGIRLQCRVREDASPSISPMKAIAKVWSMLPMAGSEGVKEIPHTFRHYQHLPDRLSVV